MWEWIKCIHSFNGSISVVLRGQLTAMLTSPLQLLLSILNPLFFAFVLCTFCLWSSGYCFKGFQIDTYLTCHLSSGCQAYTVYEKLSKEIVSDSPFQFAQAFCFALISIFSTLEWRHTYSFSCFLAFFPLFQIRAKKKKCFHLLLSSWLWFISNLWHSPLVYCGFIASVCFCPRFIAPVVWWGVAFFATILCQTCFTIQNWKKGSYDLTKQYSTGLDLHGVPTTMLASSC